MNTVANNDTETCRHCEGTGRCARCHCPYCRRWQNRTKTSECGHCCGEGATLVIARKDEPVTIPAAEDMGAVITALLDDGYAVEITRIPGGAELAADMHDKDQDDDGTEQYCTTCGHWAGIFIGHGDGWHHYRGEGTAASPVELYDVGHEVTAARTVPAGRSLSPADIGIIRQALADASAWRSWRAEGMRCAECSRLDPGRCAGHAADDELAARYDALTGRLASGDLAYAAPTAEDGAP
jgi:hypothetical protein